jgi:hypothetical protein
MLLLALFIKIQLFLESFDLYLFLMNKEAKN